MSKIVVGMSGGVDSAVTAYLLKAAGHDVVGVTLRTWISSDGADSRCCEIDDARLVADSIGIEYRVVNRVGEFTECVTKPFIDDYIHGLTPNPCVICNRTVKWAGMIDAAKMTGADLVATGHYASVVKMPNGRYTVQKAAHSAKDQTYMLYRLSREQLAMTVMPLGKLTKQEVRDIAVAAGLPVADKADSQEICFVPDGDYAGYIEDNAQSEIPPHGNFVDEDGNILGEHKGIIHYTVGQRKGLGIALGYPAFVKRICADTNEVVLGSDESLYGTEVFCRDLNFLSISGMDTGEKIRCKAKIRYHHEAAPAVIEMTGGDLVKIIFDEKVRAATPGQSAVFYDEEDRVIGGGIITLPEH